MNDLISKKDETLEITLKNLYAQGYLTKQRLWQLSHELDLIIQKRVLNFNHGNSTSISFGNYTMDHRSDRLYFRTWICIL